MLKLDGRGAGAEVGTEREAASVAVGSEVMLRLDVYAQAMKAAGAKGDWACVNCEAEVPASVADLTVTDSSGKAALGFFKERRPDYFAAE